MAFNQNQKAYLNGIWHMAFRFDESVQHVIDNVKCVDKLFLDFAPPDQMDEWHCFRFAISKIYCCVASLYYFSIQRFSGEFDEYETRRAESIVFRAIGVQAMRKHLRELSY